MRTRVKICGITRPSDAQAAAHAGADAIGLVFYAKSPRAVTIEQAQSIVTALPPFVTVVGLFVDARPEQVSEVLAAVAVDVLQFHGDECVADCRAYGRPYIKAVSMCEGVDVAGYAAAYADAQALLLDTAHAQVRGGSGESFDWARVPANLNLPVILAGGLHAGNVAAAIQQAHPYAVDVSSGVEISKGIKDAAKIVALINEVNRVDTHS